MDTGKTRASNLVIISTDKPGNTKIGVGLSASGAKKGATVGFAIGCRFGPQGAVVGTIIGGLAGFVLGKPDEE